MDPISIITIGLIVIICIVFLIASILSWIGNKIGHGRDIEMFDRPVLRVRSHVSRSYTGPPAGLGTCIIWVVFLALIAGGFVGAILTHP